MLATVSLPILFQKVAAKITKEYEDGGWILANVLDYDPRSQTYEVQDEDDINRVMTLPFGDVRRLEDTCAHLRRGDAVLAVFPETTSFYPALVAKNPKSPTGSNNSNGWEVVVRFEDDEDEAGKIAARRVPARFVLRRADVEEMNDESDDED